MPATEQPAAPTPVLDKEDQIEETLAKLYHLILHNSEDHTYDYVIELLGKLLGYSREKAFAIASVIDRDGQGIIETADYETVTGHQHEIHNWGPDPRIPHCKGSLSATVEEAS